MDDELDWSDGEDDQIGQQETRQPSIPRSVGPSGSADPEDAEDCISLGDEDEEQDYDFQRGEYVPPANEVATVASPLRSRPQDDSNNRPRSPSPNAEKPEPIPQRSRGSPLKKKQDQVSPTRPTLVPPPRPTHALPAKPVASALPILAPSHPSIVEARSMTTTRNRSDKTTSITEIPPSQEALPPGWEMRYPRNGEGVYYYNIHTEESTWKRPSFIGSLTATNETRNRDDKRRNGRATSPARRRRNDQGAEDPLSSRNARAPMEYPAAPPAGDSDIPSTYEERHYRPDDARSRSTMVPPIETTDRRGDYYRDDALPLPRTDADYMRPLSPSHSLQARGRGYEREPTPPPPGRDAHPLPHQGRGGRYHTTDGDYRDDREIYPPSHRAWAPESRQDSQHPQHLPSSEQTASERQPLPRNLSTRERNRGSDFHRSADTRGRDIPAQSTGSPPTRDARPRVSHNGPGNSEHHGPEPSNPRTLPGHRKKSRFEPSPPVPPPPPPAAMLMRRLTPPLIEDDPNLVPEEFLHEPAPDTNRHFEEVSVVVMAPHEEAPTPFSVTPSQVSDQDYQGSQGDRLSPGNIEETHPQMSRRRAPLPSQTASFRGSSGPQSRGGSRRPTQSPSGTMDSIPPTQSTDNQSFGDNGSDYNEHSQSMMFTNPPSSTKSSEGREHTSANLSADGTAAVSNRLEELSVSRRSPGLPARPQDYPERKQGREKETRRGAPKKNENDRATGNGRRSRRERGRPQLSLTNSIPVSKRRTVTNGTPSQATNSVDPPHVREGGVREVAKEAVPVETRPSGGARSYDPPEQPMRSPVTSRQSAPQNKSPSTLRVDSQIRMDPNELASSQPRIWTPRGEEPPPEFRQTVGNDNLATTPPPLSRTTSMNSPTSQRGLTHRRYSDSSSRHLEPPPPLHHPPMSDHIDPRQERGYSNEPSPRYTSRSPVLSRPSPVEYEARDGYLRPPHPELPRRSSVDYGPVYPHDMRWESSREDPPPRIPQTHHDHYDMVDEDRTYVPPYAAPLPPPHPHHERMPVDDTYFPEYPHDYSQDRAYDRRPEMGRNPSLLDRISMDDNTSLQERVHIPSKREREDYSREARDERHNGLAQDPTSKRQRRRPNGGGGRSRRGDRRGGGLEV